MYIICDFACSNCLHLPHYKTLNLLGPIFLVGEGGGVIESNDFQYKPLILEIYRLSPIYSSKIDLPSK